MAEPVEIIPADTLCWCGERYDQHENGGGACLLDDCNCGEFGLPEEMIDDDEDDDDLGSTDPDELEDDDEDDEDDAW